MLLLVEILKLVAEIALMAIAGQWILGLLAGVIGSGSAAVLALAPCEASPVRASTKGR